MFVVLSGKCKKDYKKFFKVVKYPFPNITVKTVTMDFEAAMWGALPLLFPTVTILCYYFHWVQAVWRKVQEFGIQVAYNSNDTTHKYICRLLPLPYLPIEHISTIIVALEQKAAT